MVPGTTWKARFFVIAAKLFGHCVPAVHTHIPMAVQAFGAVEVRMVGRDRLHAVITLYLQ